jgi:ketosteroid isomerase-like protein
VLRTCSNDIDWKVPEVDGIAFTGRRHGINEVAEFFRQMLELQEPREFVADEFLGLGDKVIVLGHCTWTVKATGQDYSDEFCHLFRVKDGKIAIFQEYSDTHRAALAYQPIVGKAAGKVGSRPAVH